MQEGVSRMSPVKRAACVLAAGAALGVCVAPSIAKADPVVDAAVAQLNDLGIGTLTGMPSGRTTYRTTEEVNAELMALATTYPKVAALLDKVRLIDLPLTNPDGHAFRNAAGNAAPRRASCGPFGAIVPPATCTTTGVDLNRNYPFGWGSNIGVSLAARGTGPGSEPEVKNTMDIVLKNQVVTLVTQHTNSRAIFYPGME